MAVKIQSDGYFEITYKDFDGGLNVQQPESEISDNETPAGNNFQTRNKELRSRPAFSLKFPGPRNDPVLGHYSFIDANNITHTVCWDSSGLWQMAATPGRAWAQLGAPSMVPGNPVSYRAFVNELYYCNGGTTLAYWDGIASAPVGSGVDVNGNPIAGTTSVASVTAADASQVISGTTGPLSIGGMFLSELDNHLLMANIQVVDNGTGTIYSFPNRLWWSANGIPTMWDFVANLNAGFNDILDVPDVITGLATTGVSGYIFRTNGITFFDPTGNGEAPFQFDHLWAAEHGVGNVYPWSIAFYGAIGFFISVEQIYRMGVTDFEPIGGNTRDAIMADLANASASPVCSIVPTENLGYIYFTYRISIPLTNFTRVYIYEAETKKWNPPWDVPGQIQTGRCEEVWTGQLAALPIGAIPAGTASQGGGGNQSGPGGGQTGGGKGGSKGGPTF